MNTNKQTLFCAYALACPLIRDPVHAHQFSHVPQQPNHEVKATQVVHQGRNVHQMVPVSHAVIQPNLRNSQNSSKRTG